MTTPIVFSADTPLVIRTRGDKGFQIELPEGRVVFALTVPYTDCTFRLMPGPMKDTMAFDVTWIEEPL